ncbi:MAG TPA: DUF3152 domain-containing protein [Candidatus Saccharimonadales bacterium]
MLLALIMVSSVQGQTSAVTSHAAIDCKKDKSLSLCEISTTNGTAALLRQAKSPTIAEPTWLAQQRADRKIEITYTVASRGNIVSNLDEFASLAQSTLNDPRGWSRLGATFKRVTGAADFTLVLATADKMTSFSAMGCDATYSCQVGSFVIINETRWLNATPSWNKAKGSLRDYRHMVVNHETGHWLGHSHQSCRAPGSAAPVMQQQSIDLQGCAFNPWPLPFELSSTRLGVTL